jgi:hypothetical protein
MLSRELSPKRSNQTNFGLSPLVSPPALLFVPSRLQDGPPMSGPIHSLLLPFDIPYVLRVEAMIHNGSWRPHYGEYWTISPTLM